MRVLCAFVALLGVLELCWGDLNGETCLDNFTRGMPNFVLELNDSMSSGATFLGSPSLDRGRDCVAACCRVQGCNLAMVELVDGHDDHISDCFLLNCVYQQEFVCKFVRKNGFVNYVTLDVSNKLTHRREDLKEGDDEPPIAKVNADVKTQPSQEVTLSGIESWDREGIASYDWTLQHGDPSVVIEQDLEQPAFLKVSDLMVGEYVFQLIITDTADQQSTATVTVTVLTVEQTEEFCLAPPKVGRCRGSFRRWWYNPDVNDCEEFTYGGCNPNKNNYVRKEDCRQTCVNLSDHSNKGRRLQPVCDGHCLRTQFQCSDGCCIQAGLECDNTPDCSDHSDESFCDTYDKGFTKLQELDVPNSKARCVELPDTGPCRAHFRRWYYDPLLMKCTFFTYGGCAGNLNNFAEETHCTEFCEGISEKDIFRDAEESSPQESSGSAEVAIAVFLGICILVVLAVIGYCYMKKKKGKRQTNVNNTALAAIEDTEHLMYNRTTKPV
ncbi:kunitz-type protease inhibitor 1 [Pseudophryne corroboree]|uniref:kunitz-type protease inhibitor 1 n=1 Tax=Pseudophryne corroboree TaxID=495146 RepID=UPI003081571C